MQLTNDGKYPILPAPDLKFSDQNAQPVLPASWECTALLHPYSPSPDGTPQTSPFFQMCTAAISYIEGTILSIQVTGLEYGNWWYKITPNGTTLSVDEGITWQPYSINWTLPTVDWLGNQATYFKTGYLNWMTAQEVDWWKQPVPNSDATTWIWFNNATGMPFRMMFGAPPPTPTTADPNQLAFFQNFSFTYFPQFNSVTNPNIDNWVPASISGFYNGNPFSYQLVEWNDCFAMTTVMTPVDSKSMPLPTHVYYQWKPDADYEVATDRAQRTAMSYKYNPDAGFDKQIAMLYGGAPTSVTSPPVLAGQGFIFNETGELPKASDCQNIGLGAEPPNWASLPAVEGTIHATIENNSALCPNQIVNIISVLFPATNEYPQGRYLWTWYSPFSGSDGTHSRPVTFMESASTIAEGGTSLALADYYDYEEMPANKWFPPVLFDLPAICTVSSEPALA